MKIGSILSLGAFVSISLLISCGKSDPDCRLKEGYILGGLLGETSDWMTPTCNSDTRGRNKMTKKDGMYEETYRLKNKEALRNIGPLMSDYGFVFNEDDSVYWTSRLPDKSISNYHFNYVGPSGERMTIVVVADEKKPRDVSFDLSFR